MIFWLLALPLAGLFFFTTAAEMPQEETQATDEAEPSNDYLGKKDFRNIALGLLGLGIVLVPIYTILKAGADHYQCMQNMKAMSQSMLSYATTYEDRLPPLFSPNGDTGLPRLDEKGRPFTWASILTNLAGFDARRSFLCPSAPGDATVIAEGMDNKDLKMSYGMYAGLDLANVRDINDQGNEILIAETSNGGANGSYDPQPLKLGGKTIDGFIIGWSAGNFAPPDDLKRVGEVTRLAWSHAIRGLTDKLNEGRHDNTINVVFLDGHTASLKASKMTDRKHWQAAPKQ